MADRTSAEVFGLFFTMLAEDPTAQHRAMARKLWGMTRGYDFAPYQMGCDDALKKLGLAHPHPNPHDSEDEGLLVYGIFDTED